MSSSSQPLPTSDDTNDNDKPNGLAFMLRAIHADPFLLNRLKDDQIVRIIRDTAAEIARLEALQLRAVADLDHRRRQADSVASEIALALSLTENRASVLVSAANAITTRLPRMLSLMDHGELDLYRAMKVTEATGWLSDEHAGIVDVILAGRLYGKNANQVRKAATYAALKTDPHGGSQRTGQRGKERRIRLHHNAAGVSHLSVSNAPTEKATAAYMRIDKVARDLKAKGEARTLDQIRADVAVDLLLSGNGGEAERAEVFLYLDLATYLGLNEDPAELAGHGSIPAAIARQIVNGPDTTVRRIITDPLDGKVLDLGKKHYQLSADAEEFIRVRDRECRQPGCARPAQNCRIETTPSAKDLEDGDDLVSYCSRHRLLKNRPTWRYEVESDGTLVVTTPAGDVYTSTAPPLHPPRGRSEPRRSSGR